MLFFISIYIVFFLFIISEVPHILDRNVTWKQILITETLKQNTSRAQCIYIRKYLNKYNH